MEELSPEDKLTVYRARKLQQFMFRSLFTLQKPLREMKAASFPWTLTVESVRQIVEGEVDDLPETAFTLVGDIDEVREEANKIRSKTSAARPSEGSAADEHIRSL